MKFEIINQWTGAVLFSLETESLKLCVEAAIKSSANLYGANLTSANLSGANLTSANLDGANLYGAENADKAIWGIRSIIPEIGSFCCWKAVSGPNNTKAILLCEVPADALRVSPVTGRKCRVSAVKIMRAESVDGTDLGPDAVFVSGCAPRDGHPTIEYRAGQIAVPDAFDDTILAEYAAGIHVYLTRAEAVEFAQQYVRSSA